MGSNGYHVRSYGEKMGDWQMVSYWWSTHATERALAETLLPPVGIVVERHGEPLCALWAYMSVSIGVAFLEHPVSRPGLSLLETASAMGVALDAIEEICRAHDYGLLVANTLPAIARWLERRRGFEHGGERIQMLKRITK